ncbi:MAG TPA: GNAT family N-acetyltransferase [Gemmatimonadales bacterium]|nr:GNAT family N-acetyltransferase [Gemmatimonadales bacterium]
MTIRIEGAGAGALLQEARLLFAEYAASLRVDLAFQGFEAELAGLPGAYAPPQGRVLVALAAESPAGCVGVRPLEAGICEMKRLYVRAEFRGQGIGRQLAAMALSEARSAGYDSMRLDTLASMPAARRLYDELGFVAIPPYRHTPLPGAEFLEVDLRPGEG